MTDNTRFQEDYKSLKFQDDQGNILNHVRLVVVTGAYGTLKHRYVDDPRVCSGYGNVHPEKVAEDSNIKFP